MGRACVLLACLAACVDVGGPADRTEPAPDARVVDAATQADRDAGVDAGAMDATATDATATDAAALDAATDAGPVAPTGPRLYPEGLRHAPLDAAAVARLRAVALPARADDVLAKVGDSITVSTSFLACFAGARVDLDGREDLRDTLAYFLAGDAAGTNPYARTSLAAGVGWSASRAIAGTPSPLDQELTALTPRFATLMYGTNDVGFRDYDAFMRDMVAIVDVMLAQGTIPILSSIPPRDDDANADARVPAFGGLVRALASSRELPFVDYHRELLPLPVHGLSGDGVHPRGAPAGACVLTADGLQYAANVRNLQVLEALDRVKRAVVDGTAAPDAPGPRLGGSGTADDPWRVPSLPFSSAADTRTAGVSAVDRWTSCSNADESGPELRYRITLPAPAHVTAVVASGTGADLDVHLVRAGGGAADCVARGDREASADLDAGPWDVVIDTYAGRVGELFLDVR